MKEHNYYVYILTNKSNKVLYTGVTNNLERRLWEHKNKKGSQFAKRYNLKKLVYLEHTTDVHGALFREKQIKKGPRRRKVQLIESLNPEWKDLSEDW